MGLPLQLTLTSFVPNTFLRTLAEGSELHLAGGAQAGAARILVEGLTALPLPSFCEGLSTGLIFGGADWVVTDVLINIVMATLSPRDLHNA